MDRFGSCGALTNPQLLPLSGEMAQSNECQCRPGSNVGRSRIACSIGPGVLCCLTIVMTWIKTIPISQASEELLRALQSQRSFYPEEYSRPVFAIEDGAAGIVDSHSLIPDAMFHAFATFGVLMSPELPLTRRQQEMIATLVSVTNRCFY